MDKDNIQKYSEKSMKVLMNTIDTVLSEIVWVNKDSEIVNLKQVLSTKTNCKTTGCIESLPYDDLVGAYTCLQIRHNMFDDNTTNQNNQEISNKIKNIIFHEAREKLITAGLCKMNDKGELICKSPRKVA